MHRWRELVSVLLLGAIAALILKLATAPLNAVYSAEECQAAYGEARTRQDTVAVDLHPSAALSPGKHRCGEMRRRQLDSVSAIAWRP